VAEAAEAELQFRDPGETLACVNLRARELFLTGTADVPIPTESIMQIQSNRHGTCAATDRIFMPGALLSLVAIPASASTTELRVVAGSSRPAVTAKDDDMTRGVCSVKDDLRFSNN